MTEATNLRALLARLDDGKAAFEAPLSAGSAAGQGLAEAPEVSDGRTHLGDFRAPADDLAGRRWGLVVPEGKSGDELAGRVARLCAKRAADQGLEGVKTFKVEPGLDARAASRWIQDAVIGTTGESDRPDYLLVLGDLDGVSLETQAALAVHHFVGRLAFSDPEHYEAYADKVVRCEAGARTLDCRGVALAAKTDELTRGGHRALVKPFVRESSNRPLEFRDLSEQATSIAQLLEMARCEDPTVLFSLGHGTGAPWGGWKPGDQQQKLQGALMFPGGSCLTGEDVARGRFLPGGMWFMFACFGAGTPAKSAYLHWLRDSDYGKNVADGALLEGLAAGNQQGFIAALPKAALANPDGPLSVIGHVDLAWNVSYEGKDGKAFREAVLGLADLLPVEGAHPRRIGPMFGNFIAGLRGFDAGIANAVDEAKRSKRDVELSADEREQRSRLWLRRQDLAAYMLLGDPATHLPLLNPAAAPRPSVPEVRSARRDPAPAASPDEVPEPFSARSEPEQRVRVGVDDIEKAVGAVLFRGASLSETASALGVEPAVLRAWVDAYQGAGRRALVGRAGVPS